MANETTVQFDPFVGRWHGLVSTTNWEKGRIILEWRQTLIGEGAPTNDYSDEVWSQMVGAVTAQHVGRLRRVYERFGDQFQGFEGLYWSHFHASIDWEDAEMWLEGAVQNGWSVSQMRQQRWETLGSIPEQEPRDEQVVTCEINEDVVVEQTDESTSANAVASSMGTVGNLDKRADNAEANELKPFSDDEQDGNDSPVSDTDPVLSESTAVRPFANLPELPDDIAEAFECFKLAIIRHRLDGWEEISQSDLVASLESLKQLALAPVN